MLTYESCDLCHGKPIERLTSVRKGERWTDGSCTVPANHFSADMLADAAKWDLTLVYEDVGCPKCHGSGSYEVEHVSCKIF